MKIIINKFLVLENIQISNENIEAAYKLYKSRPKYHHVSAKKKNCSFQSMLDLSEIILIENGL